MEPPAAVERGGRVKLPYQARAHVAGEDKGLDRGEEAEHSDLCRKGRSGGVRITSFLSVVQLLSLFNFVLLLSSSLIVVNCSSWIGILVSSLSEALHSFHL